MKTVRIGTFETNSSSAHAIDVSMHGDLEKISLDEYGGITLDGGEFGWGFEEYRDALTKANYVAVMLLVIGANKKRFDTTKEDISPDYWYGKFLKWCSENYDTCLSNFEDVLRESAGSPGININYNCTLDYHPTDGKNWSYIDHQSFEGIDDAKWLLTKEMVKYFIFNPLSILTIDNDN